MRPDYTVVHLHHARHVCGICIIYVYEAPWRLTAALCFVCPVKAIDVRVTNQRVRYTRPWFALKLLVIAGFVFCKTLVMEFLPACRHNKIFKKQIRHRILILLLHYKAFVVQTSGSQREQCRHPILITRGEEFLRGPQEGGGELENNKKIKNKLKGKGKGKCIKYFILISYYLDVIFFL